MKMRTASFLAFTAAAAFAATTCAQDFPARPIRIIASPPGGANDFVARLISQGLNESAGWTVLVENRPSGGFIQGELLMRAPPDGHTLLVAAGSFTIGPLFEKAVLGSCIKRVAGRKEFIRSVSRNEGGRVIVEPLARQGSHMASGLAAADRLVVVEPDVDCLEAGTLVDTVQLRWSVLR